MSSIPFLLNSLSVHEDFFPFFNSIFVLFMIGFIVVFVFVILMFALNFWRAMKSRGTQEQAYHQATPPPVVEKEIIREIVKVRCSYCGNLYDENQNKCPYCGAAK